MLTVFIGATFNMAASIQIDGAPSDFTGWSFSANLYDATGNTLISALQVVWVDQTKGLIALSAADTSTWPASKARIDCRLVSPAGDVILGPPAYLRIAQSPMSP